MVMDLNISLFRYQFWLYIFEVMLLDVYRFRMITPSFCFYHCGIDLFNNVLLSLSLIPICLLSLGNFCIVYFSNISYKVFCILILKVYLL